MKEITKYFRNAIAIQNSPVVEFKNNNFITLSDGEITKAQIDTLTDKDIIWLFSDKEHIDENEQKYANIILALKSVLTSFSGTSKADNQIDELSAILLLPARIDRKGHLHLSESEKTPWIPREYLFPMIEPQISIGDANDYDAFLEQTVDEKAQIDSWKAYLNYAKHMYEVVTKCPYQSNIISCDTKNIEMDGKFYLFLDTTVNSTFHILQLYNNMVNCDQEQPLYHTLTNLESATPKLLIPNSIEKMKEHQGQMGGEYSLSPSQRESINHFNSLDSGEILAINGPPGTGKTTLLQSVVANLYVQHAIREQEPPIIVAASTNNQAVTNIIDSFGKINPTGIANLEKRWVVGVHSFATYFPSTGKIRAAQSAGYQYTNKRGSSFFEEMESPNNRKLSLDAMLAESSDYFQTPIDSIENGMKRILEELQALSKQQLTCIDLMDQMQSVIGEVSYENYLSRLIDEIQQLLSQIEDKKNEIEKLNEKNCHCLLRISQWQQSYSKLSLFVRIFKFLPYSKRKLKNWSYGFINEDESNFLCRSMSLVEITNTYFQIIDEHDKEIALYKSDLAQLKNEHNNSIATKLALEKLIDILFHKIDSLKQFRVSIFKDEADREQKRKHFDIFKINELFDTNVRYILFWLAVHYYESRWLKEEITLSEKQMKTNFEVALDMRFKRLAMLTPCLVMTFFMLPAQFLAYDGNQKCSYHMYNYIDLLIVDEAGQISPEIAACSFSLAKKSIVVGDIYQIPPVWTTTRALDIALAIKHTVIPSKTHFPALEKCGLNCSESSLMKVASLSCGYSKYGHGLFLSEHRRCYDEIISYCNELVYNGKLEPLRGSAHKNNTNAGLFPQMGHMQITTQSSVRNGCSRNNSAEAQAIAKWILENYHKVVERYKDTLEMAANLNESELIGVITPFKAQTYMIRNTIKTVLPQRILQNIEVGTVHTFQGAERKIILFSTVYGATEGCYFIDKDKSLMNVAVSRAKDAFIVFGDEGCFSKSESAPSGLIRRHLIKIMPNETV